MNAQADMNLHRAYISKATFSNIVACMNFQVEAPGGIISRQLNDKNKVELNKIIDQSTINTLNEFSIFQTENRIICRECNLYYPMSTLAGNKNSWKINIKPAI